MPYKSMKDVNPALKGVKPPLTLAQANMIAGWADEISKQDNPPDSPWAVAIANFKKTHKAENGKWVKKSKSKESNMPEPVEEGLMSLDDVAGTVRKLFMKLFRNSDGYSKYYAEAVFMGHDLLGDVIIAWEAATGFFFAVPFEYDPGSNSATFAEQGAWVPVHQTWVPYSTEGDAGTDSMPVESGEAQQFEESITGNVLSIVESNGTQNSLVPLIVDVQLIRPGFGNPRDRHYYGAEMLRSYGGVFAGAKMYETDHRANEKSTRTWVSTVKEVKGYTEEGAPIGTVVIHDENFAKRILALSEAGIVDKMECSILASGTARAGTVEGKPAKVVESIVAVESVDWVTRAGAGGKVLSISENGGNGMPKNEPIETSEQVQETEENLEEVIINEGDEQATETAPETPGESQPAESQEQSTETIEGEQVPAPVMLSAVQVKEVLDKMRLPAVVRERIEEGEYADDVAVQEAVKKELTYYKRITGSGQVTGLGESYAMGAQRMTDEQYNERMQELFQNYGYDIRSN